MTASPWTFHNVNLFYIARGGHDSGECDFGVWWYDEGHPKGPFYRVSVVHDTGDVYARNAWDESVELLGTFEPNCVDPRVAMHHSPTCAYEQAERCFEGWADGGSKPLSWIIERLPLTAKAAS